MDNSYVWHILVVAASEGGDELTKAMRGCGNRGAAGGHHYLVEAPTVDEALAAIKSRAEEDYPDGYFVRSADTFDDATIVAS